MIIYQLKKLALLSVFVLPSYALAEIPVEFENSSTVPIVNISIVTKTGAAHDPDGLDGLTNFVGEMLIRGTNSKTKEQIDRAFDDLGAQIAIETRQEATIIRLSVLSKEFSTLLGIVEEVLTEPAFPPEEIEKLRKELISGLLESMGSDMGLAGKFFQREFYKGHPYSKSVLGRVSTLKKITAEDIQKHYQQFFKRDGMKIFGSGDASRSKILQFANHLSSKLPLHANSVKLPPTKPIQGVDVVIVDKPDRTQAQVVIGFNGISTHDSRFTGFGIGNYSFGGQAFTSRMFQEVRVKRGYSYFAKSGLSLGTHPRAWQLSLAPTEKDLTNSLSLVLKMVKEFKSDGATLAEYLFARESLINSAGFSYNTPEKRAENRLTEWLLNLPEKWTEKSAERVQSTTLNSVNMDLESTIDPNHAFVLIVGTADRIKNDVATKLGIPENKIRVIPYTSD